MKPKVLTFVARYLPGYKSGGPIRSISNLVESLGGELDFRVVTSDRDAGEDRPYPSIRPGSWTQTGKAQVLYLPPECLGPRFLFRLLASEKADYLYLNSFFGRPFSILPMLARTAGARGQERLVLAPRGEFQPGAIGLKGGRKRAWIEIAKRLQVYRSARWQASSAFEERDIRRVFGPDIDVLVASPFLPFSHDLPLPGNVQAPFKEPGSLRIVFLARITPMKNLHFAIRALNGISGNVQLDIYGPVDDADYWARCQAELRGLPANVHVETHPQVEHGKVLETLSSHHLFLLPTLGENFGHGIGEALDAGCLVLISDRTPWRGLEQSGAGWDLALEKPELFHAALERCVAMTNEEFQAASANARAVVRKLKTDPNLLAANRALFTPD
jgi:glycosyltransferase involved in cell wall biosynthesis